MKLTIELVPSSSWLNNVRAIVSKKQWDAIKRAVADKAYGMCEICGGIGPNHPVECHEIWRYDDKDQIQTLVGMTALCPDCHQVKHFGLAQVMGKRAQALKHFMKINELSEKDAEKEIAKAFKIWQKRSAKDWVLDISILSEYGIDVSKLYREQTHGE